MIVNHISTKPCSSQLDLHVRIDVSPYISTFSVTLIQMSIPLMTDGFLKRLNDENSIYILTTVEQAWNEKITTSSIRRTLRNFCDCERKCLIWSIIIYKWSRAVGDIIRDFLTLHAKHIFLGYSQNSFHNECTTQRSKEKYLNLHTLFCTQGNKPNDTRNLCTDIQKMTVLNLEHRSLMPASYSKNKSSNLPNNSA